MRSKVLCIHYSKHLLDDRAVCGFDVRRGDSSTDPRQVTCSNCMRTFAWSALVGSLFARPKPKSVANKG